MYSSTSVNMREMYTFSAFLEHSLFHNRKLCSLTPEKLKVQKLTYSQIHTYAHTLLTSLRTPKQTGQPIFSIVCTPIWLTGRLGDKSISTPHHIKTFLNNEGLYLILFLMAGFYNPANYSAGCTLLPIWPLFAGTQLLKNTK